MRLAELLKISYGNEPKEKEAKAKHYALLLRGATQYISAGGVWRAEDWVHFTPLERQAAKRAREVVRAEDTYVLACALREDLGPERVLAAAGADDGEALIRASLERLVRQ